MIWYTKTFAGMITKGSVSYLSSPCFRTPCRQYWGASLLKTWDSTVALNLLFSIIGGGPQKVMGSTRTGDVYCSKTFCGFLRQTCRYSIGGFPHYATFRSPLVALKLMNCFSYAPSLIQIPSNIFATIRTAQWQTRMLLRTWQYHISQHNEIANPPRSRSTNCCLSPALTKSLHLLQHKLPATFGQSLQNDLRHNSSTRMLGRTCLATLASVTTIFDAPFSSITNALQRSRYH